MLFIWKSPSLSRGCMQGSFPRLFWSVALIELQFIKYIYIYIYIYIKSLSVYRFWIMLGTQLATTRRMTRQSCAKSCAPSIIQRCCTTYGISARLAFWYPCYSKRKWAPSSYIRTTNAIHLNLGDKRSFTNHLNIDNMVDFKELKGFSMSFLTNK